MNTIKRVLNLNDEDLKWLIFIIILVIGFVNLIIFLPDRNPTMIKSELQKQGYDVKNIDFALFEGNKWDGNGIYQSSAPIYYEGEYRSLWVISVMPSHFRQFTVVTVKPYFQSPEKNE